MKCINCKSSSIYKIIEFKKIPISNNFTKKSDTEEVSKYPLGLIFCKKCKLVQNSKIIKNEKIFNDNYLYHSSFSTSWLKHSKNLANFCIKKFKLGKNPLSLRLQVTMVIYCNFLKKKKLIVSESNQVRVLQKLQ